MSLIFLKTLLPTFVYKHLKDVANESIIKTITSNISAVIFFFLNNSDTKCKSCNDIVVWDKPGKLNRFTIVYILHSLIFNARVALLIQTNELSPVYSITNIFNSAGWAEREI